jgi:glutamate dehydrogenase
MDVGQSSRVALLDRAAALTGDDASFARFFKAAILATDSEDLAHQSPQQLEAALRQSYGHLLAYSGDSSQLTTTPPARSGDPLVLDIVSPDMPFIVDSALAALRAAGGTVRMFTHPVVRIEAGSVSEAGEH